ncbi:MAG: CBS domain-containing protein [Methanomicrobiales archaeon]|nr:CBS domain-containing protein [Methanomicrobiales archaeon]
MNGGSLQIGTIYGIPLKLHWSLLLVIPLFAWIIGVQIGPTASILEDLFNLTIDRGIIATGFNPYILGTAVSIGLFVGVLIHELAHSLLAKKRGVKINSITLLILGGVSSIEEEVPNPRIELPMALAGPLTSLALGLVSIAVMYLGDAFIPDPPLAGVWVFLWGYLGLLNVVLFGFNILPAFPMDGGRVLRAWLAQRMTLPRATRIAANIGKAFAVLFGIFGFIIFNPILIIIAFFIYIAASQESAQLQYNVLLKDVRVGDVMSGPVMTVSPETPLTELVNRMYSTKHLGFPVVQNGSLVGMVTLDDVHRVPVDKRDLTQVKDVMTRDVLTLPPQAPLTDALRHMASRNIGRIPVMRGNDLIGIVTRTDIMRVMELRDG